MSDAYIGEIRCFGFTFAPVNWMQCNGQTLSIQAYTVLFSVIGTYYGGNGTTSFSLPNLQGQIPMHWGTTTGLPSTSVGEVQGTTAVALTLQQMPQHQHPIIGAAKATGSDRSATPTSTSYLADSKGGFVYLPAPQTAPNTAFSLKAIGLTGGTQSHDNMQPYLTLNFCICISGVFPPHS